MQVAIDLLELHTKMCNNFAKATMEEPAKGQRATVCVCLVFSSELACSLNGFVVACFACLIFSSQLACFVCLAWFCLN